MYQSNHTLNSLDARSIGELRLIWDALVRQDVIPKHADAIVIGGCRDLGLAERAAELYHAGVSNLIVISGYQSDGFQMTEAEFLANKCQELGISSDHILLEKLASNTGENIRFSAELIRKEHKNVSSIILVHKPYMSLRFLATAEAQWPEPQPTFYTTCQSISFDEYCQIHGLEETMWKLLGDFKRMDEYVANGYRTRQHVPEKARRAYEYLVNSGFSTR